MLAQPGSSGLCGRRDTTLGKLLGIEYNPVDSHARFAEHVSTAIFAKGDSRMRRLAQLLITCSTLAIGVCSASAADMAVRGPRVAAPLPMYNWSGFYVGIHGGYGSGSSESTILGDSADIDGWFAGGQIGFNWHLANSPWVFGVEADLSWADIGDSITAVVGPVGVTTATDLDYFGTARLRFGYAIDRVLLYVTGGVAWAHNEVSVTAAGGGFALGVSSDNTHTGWALGGGLEWALAPNWSMKAEYLYLDFDSETYFSGIGGGFDADGQIHTFKLGLNYRFAWGY